MKLSPNNIHIKNIMENIMKEMLVDVTPAIDESFLIISTQENGNGEKKKKKGNGIGKLLKGKTTLINLVDSQKTCAKALKCLGILLMYQGVLMKPVLYYVMQEKILAIGFKITSSVQKEDELYHDYVCRIKLCDLLLFMILHPVQKNPLPLNYCLALLTQLKHSDPDMNVRDNASENMLRAESVIHNRKEVFYFPSDYRELRDTLLFNKSTIQKLIETPSNETLRNENQSNGNSMNVEMFSEAEDDENEDEDEDNNDNNNDTQQNENQKESCSENDENENKNEDSNDDDDDDDDDEVEEEEEVENVEEIIKPPTQEIKIVPLPQKQKRQTTTATNVIEKPSKKPKISDLKDEQVVEEMLADFADD
jgi:proline-, glutamic acid- and leucine-rich protein 1